MAEPILEYFKPALERTLTVLPVILTTFLVTVLAVAAVVVVVGTTVSNLLYWEDTQPTLEELN